MGRGGQEERREGWMEGGMGGMGGTKARWGTQSDENEWGERGGTMDGRRGRMGKADNY